MICERCKFADWTRTKTGRLHPSGQGKCLWKKTFRIAGSAGKHHRRGQPITVEGGYIERKKGEEFPEQCDMFQEASQ